MGRLSPLFEFMARSAIFGQKAFRAIFAIFFMIFTFFYQNLIFDKYHHTPPKHAHVPPHTHNPPPRQSPLDNTPPPAFSRRDLEALQTLLKWTLPPKDCTSGQNRKWVVWDFKFPAKSNFWEKCVFGPLFNFFLILSFPPNLAGMRPHVTWDKMGNSDKTTM